MENQLAESRMDRGESKEPEFTSKVALITGISGQNGSYLAELMIEKCYIVPGIIRRSSAFNSGRIKHLQKNEMTHTEADNFYLHYGDMTDMFLVNIISEVQSDEIYNLAAQSHVNVSFSLAKYTADVDGVGVHHLLDAIRVTGLASKVKLYQATSSEMFGFVQEIPQKETTSFHPRSPYGVAKLFAYWKVVNYREAYNMFPCNAILFNHESPRRGETFVTRKISRGVAKVLLGQQTEVVLENLDAERDKGHAKDYVRAMWLMLQCEKPEDFVISTGTVYIVREFVVASFKHIGVDIIWEGKGLEEVGKDSSTGTVRVRVSQKYYRPAEVEFLEGDSTKAKNVLGLDPYVTFEELVGEMVEADIQLAKQHRLE